jgi:4'-phosphopantetheinyl transferase
MLRGQVHVWYVDPDRLNVDRTLDLSAELLSPEESARAARFRRASDRHVYLVAHVSIRVVLSRYYPIPPHAWRFTIEPGGKPRPWLPVGAPPLRFNLSHTRGLVAAAVALDAEVGVDVEFITPTVPPALVRTALTGEERLRLRHGGRKEFTRGFFRHWTLKEAYLKACGVGLRCPMRDLGFRCEPGQAPRIEFSERVSDDPSRWQFWYDTAHCHHAAAVAVSASSPSPLEVHVFRDLPAEVAALAAVRS